MALPNPLKAFTWGPGGAQLTPEDLAQMRQMENERAAKGVDFSPVGHWTQGLARVADALAGSVRRGQLDDAATENAGTNSRIAEALLGGGASGFPAAPSGGGQFPAAPTASGSDYANQRVAQAHGDFETIAPSVVADLSRDLNLSTEQAAGIVGQLGHESAGLQAINETNPLVPGSRGGFGWAQWTGPRRRQFEAWASENGLDLSSRDANYGFLKHELLNTPEGAVLDDLRQAPDAQTAGRVFTDKFLRPGIPGYDSRAKWTDRALKAYQQSIAGGATPAQAANEAMASGTQVASLDPSAGMMQTLPSPAFTDEQARSVAATSTLPNDTMAAIPNAVQPLTDRTMASDPSSDRVAQAFATAEGPMAAPVLPTPQMVEDRPVAEPQQQIAQALMGPNTPLDQVPVMAGGNSGVMQPGQAQQGINPAIIEALSNPAASEQTRKIASMLLGQQMQANDPATQLDMDLKRAQIAAMQAKPDKLPDSVRALNIRAQQAGLQPGTPEYTQFMISGGSGPQTVINNGNNTSEFVKKSDEAAAKRLDEIVTSGQTAQQTMADMQQLLDLGSQIGTGKEAQVKAFLGPYAQALGVDIAGLPEIQAYEAITSRLAPQMRAPGSGASSDRDVSMFLQSLPGLRNTPQGNELIANTFKAVAQSKMNAAEIASAAQRGDITWQDADKQIRELPNPYDLFKLFQKQGAGSSEWQDMGGGVKIRRKAQ